MKLLDKIVSSTSSIRKSSPIVIHVYVDDMHLGLPKNVKLNGRNGSENLLKFSESELSKLAIGDSLVHVDSLSADYACTNDRVEGKKAGIYIYFKVGNGSLSVR